MAALGGFRWFSNPLSCIIFFFGFPMEWARWFTYDDSILMKKVPWKSRAFIHSRSGGLHHWLSLGSQIRAVSFYLLSLSHE